MADRESRVLLFKNVLYRNLELFNGAIPITNTSRFTKYKTTVLILVSRPIHIQKDHHDILICVTKKPTFSQVCEIMNIYSNIVCLSLFICGVY